MGGGWCLRGQSDCLERSRTRLGSTKSYPESMGFSGVLSDDPDINPDFHNWNMVYVIYCDGASFAGDRYVHVGAGPTAIMDTVLYS